MKGSAIAFTGRGVIELVEISLPQLGDEDVLVESELTAVSQGTDRAMVTGSYAGVDDRYPFVYGYSRVGRVVEVGRAVTNVAVGDRVFVGMAGTRLDPRDGLGEQGGSYASHGVVDQTEVVKLPAWVGDSVAALGAVAAIAYQGVVACDIKARSRVLVAGLGAVGQFAVIFAALRGAQVWAADPIAGRRELAARLSGAITVDPKEDVSTRVEETAWGSRPWRGRNGPPDSRYEQLRWRQAAGPLDVVIDATGRGDAIDAYLPLLTREGCLCLQGYYSTPLALDFHAAHMKRLAIRCPGGFDLVDYETVLRLTSSVDVSQLVGLEIPVADAPEMLHDLLLVNEAPPVAAVIRWRVEDEA
ncbi:MAG TPA: zinc-binding dehydrogenase [Gaiellaceae bacterium]|nr:zinc-binding dehydrogenase [Gaiellaceae bacterium]